MRLLILLLATILCGCAVKPEVRYSSAYRLENSHRELDARTAERAMISEFDVAALTVSGLQPEERPKLLHAPQPIMGAADIDADVVGEVVVEIWFNDKGSVERTVVLSSTKESLTEAVLAVVTKWRVLPPRKNGVPSALVANQAFRFKAER
jgi:TonB family protein